MPLSLAASIALAATWGGSRRAFDHLLTRRRVRFCAGPDQSKIGPLLNERKPEANFMGFIVGSYAYGPEQIFG